MKSVKMSEFVDLRTDTGLHALLRSLMFNGQQQLYGVYQKHTKNYVPKSRVPYELGP